MKNNGLVGKLPFMLADAGVKKSSKQGQMIFHAQESVILLHGLARSKKSFKRLEKRLKKLNYHVVNIGYPSTKHSIEELAENTIKLALSDCPRENKIHFVTHSMGGILLRYYLENHEIDQLGRVVMLGPPNKGSQVVDKLEDLLAFKLINGPAGMQLGTSKESIPNQLGSAKFELGVIAGTKSFNLILSSFLPSLNDGKVTVESTKLEGMLDHIEMPVTHTFMMNDKKVINQTLYFLINGYFKP